MQYCKARVETLNRIIPILAAFSLKNNLKKRKAKRWGNSLGIPTSTARTTISSIYNTPIECHCQIS